MEKTSRNILKSDFIIVGSMIALAMSVYILHYLTFGEIEKTISGVLLSLAYVPIGVLYDFLVLKKVITKGEKIKLERRMNVVIGSVFHEIGNSIISLVVVADRNIDELKRICKMDQSWNDGDFDRLSDSIMEYSCDIDINKIDLIKLRDLITKKDQLFLDLIISSSLDDYKDFNEMIISILHLRDEFDSLFINDVLEENDEEHMRFDICKSYKLLLVFWVRYMKSLRDFYPAMFENILEDGMLCAGSLASKREKNTI